MRSTIKVGRAKIKCKSQRKAGSVVAHDVCLSKEHGVRLIRDEVTTNAARPVTLFDGSRRSRT